MLIPAYLLLSLLLPLRAGEIPNNSHEKSKTRPRIKTFDFQNTSFPNEVDLRRKFRLEVPTQGRTGTCTAFSATALFEGACKRATGEEIDLSEGYTIYLAFRERMKTCFGVPNCTLRSENNMLMWFDTSDSYPLVKTMKEGILGTEAELKYEEYFKFMESLKAELALKRGPPKEDDEDDTKEVQIENRAVLKERINQEIGEYFPGAVWKQGGWLNKTKDPQILSCLEKLDNPIEVGNLTPKQALQLIEAGQPFLCVGPGSVTHHANIIMGYRQGKPPVQIEWLFRDSASNGYDSTTKKQLQVYWKNWDWTFKYGILCNHAVVLPTLEESARIQPLLKSLQERKKKTPAFTAPPEE